MCGTINQCVSYLLASLCIEDVSKAAMRQPALHIQPIESGTSDDAAVKVRHDSKAEVWNDAKQERRDDV